jgi:hypothetical protein
LREAVRKSLLADGRDGFQMPRMLSADLFKLQCIAPAALASTDVAAKGSSEQYGKGIERLK